MPDYQSKVPQQLQELIQLTKISNNEQCCKLRELITLSGGGSETAQTIISGVKKLTGTASFSTSTSLSGINTYRSVSISVVSLTTGTVVLQDPSGATSIPYAGLNLNFGIDKDSDTGLLAGLIVSTTGDSIVIVSYTGTA